MKKYIPEVCLDTNIVISLANIQNHIKEEINSYDKNHTLLSLCELLTKIKNKEIIAYITPTVQQEILAGVKNFGENTKNFVINSNIKIIKFSRYSKKLFAKNTETYAEMYSRKISEQFLEKLTNHLSIKREDITSCVFKPKKHNGKRIPINDAKVMAEASQLGLVLVTNDKKDFIDKHRPELISCINKLLKLNVRAKPYNTTQICLLLNNQIELPKMELTWRKELFKTWQNEKSA